MSEHADYLTDEDEQEGEQEDLYFDHLAGHPAFPCVRCNYCEEEYRRLEEG